MFSFLSLAAVNVELHFSTPEVQQGSIVLVQLSAHNQGPGFDASKLTGKTIGNLIYVYEINDSSAKIVFTKIPESNVVKDTIEGHEVNVSWQDISVLPTEIPKAFLFGEFEIPSRPRILLWISLITGTLVVGLIGSLIAKRYKTNALHKNERKRIISELIDAKRYEEIVQVWTKKNVYIQVFPQMQVPFQDLEKVLFKFLFKSEQLDEEKKLMVEAYRDFLRSIEGVINGV